MVSLLIFLILILAFSEYCEAILVNSCLLSSLNFGIGSLIMLPSVWGFIPKFDSIIAVSIFLIKELSHTWIVRVLESGTLILANWEIGDLELAIEMAGRLKNDKKFYDLCSEKSLKRFKSHYTEKAWKENWEKQWKK